MPLLTVTNLTVYFHTRNGVVRAVEDVSFEIEKGQTVAIVGESGSGKSVTCYSLMGLVPQPPGRIESGSAIFDGKIDLLKCPPQELNRIRGKRIAMIFQDPMTSLNPYLRIEDQLIEPLMIHEAIDRARRRPAGHPRAGGGRRAGRGPSDSRLPPRILRRHAPARYDRDGAHRPARIAHRR